MDLDGDGVEECVCEFDMCDELSARRRRRLRRTVSTPDSRRQSADEYGENEHHESDGQKPICGSDRRLYPSTCYMDKESCIRQTPIYQEEVSFCGSATLAPALDTTRQRNWAAATVTIPGTGCAGARELVW